MKKQLISLFSSCLVLLSAYNTMAQTSPAKRGYIEFGGSYLSNLRSSGQDALFFDRKAATGYTVAGGYTIYKGLGFRIAANGATQTQQVELQAIGSTNKETKNYYVGGFDFQLGPEYRIDVTRMFKVNVNALYGMGIVTVLNNEKFNDQWVFPEFPLGLSTIAVGISPTLAITESFELAANLNYKSFTMTKGTNTNAPVFEAGLGLRFRF